MPEVKLTAEVDTTRVDEAIRKVQRLSELLREAKSLIDDLASMELNLDIKVKPMGEKKKSAEQSALGDELDRILGPDEFKVLGQELALVVAKHELARKPEICEKVFRYMSFVISGWNSV